MSTADEQRREQVDQARIIVLMMIAGAMAALSAMGARIWWAMVTDRHAGDA